jgi:subtilase family serine protease
MTTHRLGARPGATPNRLRRAAPAGIAVTAMLLAVCGPAVAAGGTAAAAAHRSGGGTGDCDSVTTCYTPQQIRVAYGIAPLTARGLTGRGETVVLPAIGESKLNPPLVSNIRQDLAGFDTMFHLPAPRLQIDAKLAPGARPSLSYGEETLDVEMIHAIAPAAAIRVILFTPTSLSTARGYIGDLIDTMRIGASGPFAGNVISSSAGTGENCWTRAEVARLHRALRAAREHHVTVVAATGDIGPVAETCTVSGSSFTPVRGVTLPASDPLVLAAGGTSLTASHKTGAYIREIAWGLPYGDPGTTFQASGGGFSKFYSRPGYQNGTNSSAARGVPDVSGDASGHTGMALVISDNGQNTIRNSGGTSATAPFWAGLIAVADQYAGHSLGFVNPALYRIARGPRYHQAFHDITTGNTTVKFPPRTFRGYRAAPGWDAATGLGSPDASVLVPLLAHGGHG